MWCEERLTNRCEFTVKCHHNERRLDMHTYFYMSITQCIEKSHSHISMHNFVIMYSNKVREYNAGSKEKGMVSEFCQRTLFIFGKFSNSKKILKFHIIQEF